MKDVYKLSRSGTIRWMVQRELLERFGDGRPFRWRDVRDAYKRAWKSLRKKEPYFDPTLGVRNLLDETDWIINHQDSVPIYYAGGQSYHKGIWRTIVPVDQLRECQHYNATGQAQDAGTIYYWDEPGSPKCVVCRKLHPNPINVRRIGKHEVF